MGFITLLIRQWIHQAGENIEGLIAMLGGVFLIGLIIFKTTRAIIRKIRR
jgi:hypothetical protein